MASVLITRGELAELLVGFNEVGNLRGIKFSYAVAKNTQMIESEIKPLQKGLEPTESLTEYEKKRVELCKKHAKKDPDGHPIKVQTRSGGESYQGLDGHPAFEKDMEKLKKEYKEDIEAVEKLAKEYNEALKEEIDFDLHMVALDNVPEDITAGQMSKIIRIIDDSEMDQPEKPKKGKSKKK